MTTAIPQDILDLLLLTNCLTTKKTTQALLEAGANPNQFGTFVNENEKYTWHLATALSWDFMNYADAEDTIFEYLKHVDIENLNEMTEEVDLADHPYGPVLLTGHRRQDKNKSWYPKTERLSKALISSGVRPPKFIGNKNLISEIYERHFNMSEGLYLCSPDVFRDKFNLIRQLFTRDELVEILAQDINNMDGEDDPKPMLEWCIDDWDDWDDWGREPFLKVFISELIKAGASIYQAGSDGRRIIDTAPLHKQDFLLSEHAKSLAYQSSEKITNATSLIGNKRPRI